MCGPRVDFFVLLAGSTGNAKRTTDRDFGAVKFSHVDKHIYNKTSFISISYGRRRVRHVYYVDIYILFFVVLLRDDAPDYDGNNDDILGNDGLSSSARGAANIISALCRPRGTHVAVRALPVTC